MAENVSMIGCTRVSKADGRQVHDLQCDALIAVGVDLSVSAEQQRCMFRPIAWTQAPLGLDGVNWLYEPCWRRTVRKPIWLVGI